MFKPALCLFPLGRAVEAKGNCSPHQEERLPIALHSLYCFRCFPPGIGTGAVWPRSASPPGQTRTAAGFVGFPGSRSAAPQPLWHPAYGGSNLVDGHTWRTLWLMCCRLAAPAPGTMNNTCICKPINPHCLQTNQPSLCQARCHEAHQHATPC